MTLQIFKTEISILACVTLLAMTSVATQAAESSANDPHAKHRAMMKKPQDTEAASAEVELLNSPMTTQNGETVQFKTDVVGDQIVVIDFVYTTCTTVCPVISAIFQQVQNGLDDRPDAEVRLISVSIDPVRDTPERLKEYADKLQASENWVWLTGEKTTVDDVLRGLGAYTPDFEDHPSIVLVGDPRSGTWKRFFGFPSPKKILAAVDEMSAERKTAYLGN
jgi:protein SCO1/2